jgi:uncharacterized lipoprotein YddW (UPF0748 family)
MKKIFWIAAIGWMGASCSFRTDVGETSPHDQAQPNEIAGADSRSSFVFATWVHGGGDFDSTAWRNKLHRYDSIGISEILVSGQPDFLQHVVDMASGYNILVHAWMWTLNRPNDPVAMQHPDWYAVNRKGDNSLDYRAYVNYYQWLSPFHPAAREYIKQDVLKRAKVRGIGSVHLDYVRYPDVILGRQLQKKYGIVQDREYPEYDYGYHPIAREGFKEIFGYDPLDLANPELSAEWRQYRLNAVSSLVNECAALADSMGVDITAAVFPFPEMSRHMVKQAWDDWDLDRAYPMIYQSFYEEGVPWIGFVTAQCVHDVDFPIMAGLYSPALRAPEDLEKAIGLAHDNGARGVSFFQVDGMTPSQVEVLCRMTEKYGG